MVDTDEWNLVETILSNVLSEKDSEKLVYALKTSMKHEFEEMLDLYSHRINEPVEILLIGNDPKFMRELIATFGRSKLISSIRFTGQWKKPGK